MKLNLPLQPEPSDSRYSCYNTGGVELEVAEFLYGFIRMIKPSLILETGTHKGISASYMASALRENGCGKIISVEYESIHYNDAKQLISSEGLSDWAELLLTDSRYLATGDKQFDFIFHDTEPQIRFSEFVALWPKVRPGGFVGIHDLHCHMGQTGQTINGVDNWPFGTIPAEMRGILKDCQSFHFPTPRGFFLCQKSSDGFYSP